MYDSLSATSMTCLWLKIIIRNQEGKEESSRTCVLFGGLTLGNPVNPCYFTAWDLAQKQITEMIRSDVESHDDLEY